MTEISDRYDELLGGMSQRPTNADSTNITVLQMLATAAPWPIPAWFDEFIAKPPMPQPPEIPTHLEDAMRDWAHNVDTFELDLTGLDPEQKTEFTELQQRWNQYEEDLSSAQSYFEMVRCIQWPTFYARMLLHSLNLS